MNLNIIKTTTQNEDDYRVEYFDITVEGQKVGEGSMMVSDSEPAYLERIDIDEAHQGKGYGTAAIYELSNIYGGLAAAPDNENCQRLFERIGTEIFDHPADQGFGVYEV